MVRKTHDWRISILVVQQRRAIFQAEGGFHCSDRLAHDAANTGINAAQLRGTRVHGSLVFRGGDAVVHSFHRGCTTPCTTHSRVSIPAQVISALTPTVDLGVVNSGVRRPMD